MAPELTVATFVLVMLVVPGVAPVLLRLGDAMMGS